MPEEISHGIEIVELLIVQIADYMELWNHSCDKQLTVVDHWISAKYLLHPSEYSRVSTIFCLWGSFLSIYFTFKSTHGKKVPVTRMMNCQHFFVKIFRCVFRFSQMITKQFINCCLFRKVVIFYNSNKSLKNASEVDLKHNNNKMK